MELWFYTNDRQHFTRTSEASMSHAIQIHNRYPDSAKLVHAPSERSLSCILTVTVVTMNSLLYRKEQLCHKLPVPVLFFITHNIQHKSKCLQMPSQTQNILLLFLLSTLKVNYS